ncbi:MAG: Alanine--tRNA ligase [Syntrophorhabdus sp. PtaU1.Bin058]|nr:MAG: Alanine--tRNA ligase [Syntrophorhabdus sp. PtaU1.Bin058]
MTSKEIRKTFLDFFSGRGHRVVQSASLVPEKDPTLLFVNAGMVPFKNLFLGDEKRDYQRATSCQKCVRAGGKHNDLDNIGKTLRHHTFFEMLGNFSFGDYFKKDAIAYAWEFLTKTLNIDTSRMWITVYQDDNDAAELWRQVGVQGERIVRLGEKDNFWSMGDEGPCGPCSEILYDLGEHVGCRQPDCKVGCDCDRFLEIWNLVFMEFDRSADGQMKKLPRPSIDTGMGLERITSILEGKIGNYDTDLFVPILKRLEDISGRAYGQDGKADIAMRVIADHARGATFIVNDGILPSKEGRGYVLRRIIRRALRYGKKIGIGKEFFYDLTKTVVDLMEDVYPEVRNNHPYIVRVIKGEEERFMETLSTGMKVYEEITEGLVSKGIRTIPGDLVYKLYDTHGFPLDITMEMAEEDGLSVDMEGFKSASQDQKERSRTASKIKGEEWDEGHLTVLREGISSTFTGYTTLKDSGTVERALVGTDLVDEIEEGDEGELFFACTPFYAESGGQTSDEGLVHVVRADHTEGRAKVLEVAKIKDNLFSHRVKVEKGAIRKGDRAELIVDTEKRKGVSRNHTATHLLHYALRKVLGDHVKQSGSSVEQDRLRFDFTHFEGMNDVETAKVEDIVNEKIMACIDINTEEKSREDAIRDGATALFEEKYGEKVRVIRIGDFSMELCGGTHVRNTGEIGSFYITSEGSLASGVRRIEAVTGRSAIAYKRKVEKALKAVARLSNAEVERVGEKVESIVSDLEKRGKEIERLKEEIVSYRVEEALQEAFEKDGTKVVSLFVPNAGAEELRKVTDIIRNKTKSCIAIVGSQAEDKGLIVLAVTKDLQSVYNAGKIVKRISEQYGGKGGGGPQIAQGGVAGRKVKDALKDLDAIFGP